MPDAFSLGPLIVPIGRAAALAAFVMAIWIAGRTARHHGLDASGAVRSAELAVLAFVLGARAGYVAQFFGAYADAPWTALYLWQPGYLPWVGAVAAALTVAVRLVRGTPSRRAGEAWALATAALVGVATFTVAAYGLPALFGPSATVRVGDTLPDRAFQDLNGHAVATGELREGPLVLNFWASWCPPCRREMPAFDAVARAYQDQGVQVVGLAVAQHHAEVRSFLTETPVSYRIWLDDPAASSASASAALMRSVGGIGLPTTVFVAADGTVQRVRIGELSRAVITDEVERLLSR